jgi:hypothetical protein
MKKSWTQVGLPGADTLKPVMDNVTLTLAVGKTGWGTTTVRFESNGAYIALGNAVERANAAKFARELLRLCATQGITMRDPPEVFE